MKLRLRFELQGGCSLLAIAAGLHGLVSFSSKTVYFPALRHPCISAARLRNLRTAPAVRVNSLLYFLCTLHTALLLPLPGLTWTSHLTQYGASLQPGYVHRLRC